MQGKRIPSFAAFWLLTLLVTLMTGSCRQRDPELKLDSGPHGGTFVQIATGLAELLSKQSAGFRVKEAPSGGSVANLLGVQKGDLDMGFVFAGDAYLGWLGRLKEELSPTTGVLAITRLYGATAHLVVSRQSSIRTVSELRGRRVAIGSAGSCSAQVARRYFESIALWERIIPVHEGYAIGMADLQRGHVDAVWLQVGYSNEHLLEVGKMMPLRLIDLYDSALIHGFFSTYSFYSYVSIPSGTYGGQEKDILTFQDAALWVAGPKVTEDFVYNALHALFNEKGMERMHAISPVARDVDIAKGLMGVMIPLHPGAARFWRDQGASLPSSPQRQASNPCPSFSYYLLPRYTVRYIWFSPEKGPRRVMPPGSVSKEWPPDYSIVKSIYVRLLADEKA